jgi:hypothetical protein
MRMLIVTVISRVASMSDYANFPGKFIASVMLVRSFFTLPVVRFDIVLGRAFGDENHGERDRQTPKEDQLPHSLHGRQLLEALAAYRKTRKDSAPLRLAEVTGLSPNQYTSDYFRLRR